MTTRREHLVFVVSKAAEQFHKIKYLESNYVVCKAKFYTKNHNSTTTNKQTSTFFLPPSVLHILGEFHDAQQI